MLRFCTYLLICLCTCGPSTLAQDTATNEDPDPIREITGAGFTMNFEDIFRPHVIETSNATIYGLSYYRKNNYFGELFVADTSMPYLHLIQTIAPLSSIGTAEELLIAVVGEAQNSIKAMGVMTELPEPTECTRMILGQVRTGSKIAITFPAEDGAEPATGFVECYAFEHSSKGVGVTIKYQNADPERSFVGPALAERMLENLELISIEPFTPYTYMLGGYPIALPVQSRVEDITQSSPNAVVAQVSLANAKLVIQMGLVPVGYSPWSTIIEQTDKAEYEIDTQIKEGNLDLHWRTQTCIPAGPDGKGTVKSYLNIFTINDQTLNNAVYAHTENQVVIIANFTSLLENSEDVHKAAMAMFSNAKFDLGPEDHEQHHLPGYTLNHPDDYRVFAMPNALDTVLVTFPYGASSAEALLNGVTLRSEAYSRLKFFDASTPTDLQAEHWKLCQEVRDRHMADEKTPTDFADDAQVQATTLADGTKVQSITSTFAPDVPENLRSIVPEETLLTVTSYLLPKADEQSRKIRCIGSTIANKWMHADADSLTQAVLGWLEPAQTPGTLDLPFATMSFNAWEGFGWHSTGYNGADYNVINVGTVKMSITSRTPDDDIPQRSAQLLAERSMREIWNWNTESNENDLFPVDTNELTKTTFAGYPALVITADLMPPQDSRTSPRTQAQRIRLYGFTTGDQYTTVLLLQEAPFDDAVLDDLVARFQPKE
ncbi:MAG: hypothetical protein JKY96_06825 [Phycisphaerales bacterium]|nr:hypothetical protein [Phycisphaerales bacterium]